MFDLVTIGHFSIDLILPLGARKPRRRLGGPPTYTSVSARRLGVTVSVVSRVGRDFPEAYLRWLVKEGVDLSCLKIDETYGTTSFLIKYRVGGERDMFLRSRAPPISAEDMAGLEARAVHISPIANEVSITIVEKIANMAPVVTLDPQGLLRGFDSDGRVFLRGISDLTFLRHVDVLKASEGELKAMTGLSDVVKALEKIRGFGVKAAIATVGVSGAFISLNKGIFYIPAAPPRRFIDPTGAGDSFMGSFLTEYIRGEDALWCAALGSSAASYVVEEIGPKGFKGRRRVYERARWVYERIVKVAGQT